MKTSFECRRRPTRGWSVALLGAGVCLVSPARSTLADQDPDTVEILAPDFYAPETSLRAYVDKALAVNPSLAESEARYRAALERVPQVDALPDPTLTFTQAIRSVETRVGPQLNSISVAQRFPWFGKLDLRGEVVMRDALAAHQAHRARQRDVVVNTKRAYYELAYADTAIAITTEEQSLLDHYASLAETRYATGQGLLQAVIKLQAETTRLMNRLDILQQQRASIEARLNTLMDQPADNDIPPLAAPLVPPAQLGMEELYALGLDHREELKASQERILKSQKAIELAQRDRWPDLVVGLSFVNVGRRSDPAGITMPPPDDGKNALSLSAGINLPLFGGKYDASIREAGETLSAERSRYAHLVNEMEFSIRDEMIRVETLHEQIRLFQTALIPQTEETLRATESAYETGQLGVLDLLDSERTLLSTRLVNARYHADLLIALANLERAVGTQFPR